MNATIAMNLVTIYEALKEEGAHSLETFLQCLRNMTNKSTDTDAVEELYRLSREGKVF